MSGKPKSWLLLTHCDQHHSDWSPRDCRTMVTTTSSSHMNTDFVVNIKEKRKTFQTRTEFQKNTKPTPIHPSCALPLLISKRTREASDSFSRSKP